jgi:prepilin-type N-terminal cleavage/methylation domain-containing protein
MKRKRAFTLIELLVVIAIIALLIGLLLPALAKAQRNAKSLKDQTQIKEIHKAMTIFSNDHKGRLPIPGLVKRQKDPYTDAFLPGVGPEDFVQNDSARLYSLMVSHEFFNTDLLIGPTEVSPVVVEDDDYNFDAFQPGETIPTFWDDTFGADLDESDGSEECNTSYAHEALCGQRKKIKWRNTQIEGHPIVSTRGTDGTNEPVGDGIGGDMKGDNYTRSPTVELHGPKDQWVGNVVFSDNHTESLEAFYPTLTSYEPLDGDGPQKDNIFSAEFSDYDNGNQEASADAWMVVCRKDGSSENRVAQIYDELNP